MQKNEEGKIILKLSEHDISRLLLLIKKEISQTDKTWQPYWERLAQNVQQSVDWTDNSFQPPTCSGNGSFGK